LGPLKKRERTFLQDSSSGPIKMMEQANKIEKVRTKPRNVLYEVEEQKITGRYPIVKSVSLSDFQIGGDIWIFRN
jgi:hypothetical protein